MPIADPRVALPEGTRQYHIGLGPGELAEYKAKHPEKKVAPFAVNQIVHSSNDRLMHDVELCEKYKVPIQITSLRAPDE